MNSAEDRAYAVMFVALVVSLPSWLMLIALFQFVGHGAWRKTSIGRNLMVLSAVIAYFEAVWLSRAIFGSFPGWRIVLAIGSVVVAIVGWHRVGLWIERFREERNRGKERDR